MGSNPTGGYIDIDFGFSPRLTACVSCVCCKDKTHCLKGEWPCGLMDKALVFGTKDCRFESCQGHISSGAKHWTHWLNKIICNSERAQRKPSLHWGLNPGPSVYKTDALPLSYRGHAEHKEPQKIEAKKPNARKMDTLGIEPRASRMLSGCDTTTPCAP